jgi:hypothetical protein
LAPVGLEVVRAAEPVVVAAGRVRHRGVDLERIIPLLAQREVLSAHGPSTDARRLS